MGLKAVSFVRCFQMTHESLDAALSAAAGEGSSLRMVAFSHLDLAEWREKQAYILPQSNADHSSDDFGLRLIPQSFVQAPSAGSLQVQPTLRNVMSCHAAVSADPWGGQTVPAFLTAAC